MLAGAPPTDAAWSLGAWQAVLARTTDHHPFVLPAWQRAWWEHLGEGRLSVMPLQEDGATIGVAALCRDDDGVMRFLGDPRVTDYPGPAIVPGHEAAAARALIAALLDDDLDWRVLDVRDQRPEAGFDVALVRAARESGLHAVIADDEPVMRLALPATRDRHLAGLRPHARHELRRKHRRLTDAHGPTCVRTASAATLDDDLATFLALFRQARGPKAAFLTSPISAFLQHVTSALLDLGLLHLDLLEAGDRALAAALGFRTGTTHYLYNVAYDHEAAAGSPGIVLLDRLIEQAIDDGLQILDLLRGAERYKLELGAVPSLLRRVVVRR